MIYFTIVITPIDIKQIIKIEVDNLTIIMQKILLVINLQIEKITPHILLIIVENLIMMGIVFLRRIHIIFQILLVHFTEIILQIYASKKLKVNA